MSQLVYLKETTTITVETKVVEIPDYTERLKELREQAAIQKVYSEACQKRIETTVASPFEQIAIYLSELFRPFLNDPDTIKSRNRLSKTVSGFSCVLHTPEGEEPFIKIMIHVFSKGGGCTYKPLVYIYRDRMVMCTESIPVDSYNIKNLLGQWDYFKQVCNDMAKTIVRNKQAAISTQKRDYETTIDVINNFTV